jgi:hypothetical protein
MVNLLPVRPEQVYVTPLASRMNRRDFPATEPEIAGPYILLVANTTSNKNCERVMAAIALLRTRAADPACAYRQRHRWSPPCRSPGSGSR